jgi:hypothetical protein
MAVKKLVVDDVPKGAASDSIGPKRSPENISEVRHALAFTAALGFTCFSVALAAAHFVGN